jgi:flagellar biosynthesis/type III secretory pathway protein FliH
MKQQAASDQSAAARRTHGAVPEAPGNRRANVEVFKYLADADAPAAPDWSGYGSESNEPAQSQREPDPEFEQRLAEETRRAFDQGRERGRQEGRQAEREQMAAALKAAQDGQVRQSAALTESFVAARDRYLHQVEHEVVKLALAIAARILRREAQMDPLLLTGAARVALGQLASTTEVKLRVPPGDLDLWTEAIALIPNLPLKPAVIAGDGLRLGDCLIETGVGTVDLGIRAQLAEIERGFFDRAGAGRPLQAFEAVEPMGQPERGA